ncbi:MAG: PIG-L deacetylase family protein [Verrucomicrobiota bacterium]
MTYREFVETYARLYREGRQLPLGGFPPAPRPDPAPGAPRVLIFSPHPDDECIIGGLPLRLMRECGWRVVNVAVTQGSNRDRQTARLGELRAACQHLGFDLVTLGDRGLEKVAPGPRTQDPEGWAAKVGAIADVLRQHQPRAILFPHLQDWNGSHIGVHHLVMDALATLGPDFATHLVETEFWGQNYSPNLLVETSAEDLTHLIEALTFHVGEVQRNPYHLTLPAWMINNVRLGGETVGGQGAAPPDFPFGTVYRLRRWQQGAVVEVYRGGRLVTLADNPGALFDTPPA